MTTFTIHTVESAPAEVKEVLETVQKDNNGYILIASRVHLSFKKQASDKLTVMITHLV